MSYDATGYKNYTIKRFSTLLDSTEFCKAPYDHINLWTMAGVWRDETERSFIKTYTENNQTITEYSYDYCAPCPSNGTSYVTNEYGGYYQWDSKNEILRECSPDETYYYGYGLQTECMWGAPGTSGAYADPEYEDPSDYCVAFMGTDTTGSFEYRYSDGDWYDCGYSD